MRCRNFICHVKSLNVTSLVHSVIPCADSNIPRSTAEPSFFSVCLHSLSPCSCAGIAKHNLGSVSLVRPTDRLTLQTNERRLHIRSLFSFLRSAAALKFLRSFSLSLSLLSNFPLFFLRRQRLLLLPLVAVVVRARGDGREQMHAHALHALGARARKRERRGNPGDGCRVGGERRKTPFLCSDTGERCGVWRCQRMPVFLGRPDSGETGWDILRWREFHWLRKERLCTTGSKWMKWPPI